MKYDIWWIVMVMSLRFSWAQLTDTSETQNSLTKNDEDNVVCWSSITGRGHQHEAFHT